MTDDEHLDAPDDAEPGRVWTNPTDPAAWASPAPPALAAPPPAPTAPWNGASVPSPEAAPAATPLTPWPLTPGDARQLPPYVADKRSSARPLAIVMGVVVAFAILAIAGAGYAILRHAGNHRDTRRANPVTSAPSPSLSIARSQDSVLERDAGDPSAVAAVTLLAGAEAKTTAAQTVRTRYTITAASFPGVGGPVTLAADGVIDFEHKAQAITMDGSSLFAQLPAQQRPPAGTDLRIELRQLDSVLYFRMPMLDVVPSLAGKWLRLDLVDAAKQAGVDLSAIGGSMFRQDPASALSMLGGADAADVTNVGAETIDDVATTHYRSTVDIDKALTRSGLSPAAKDKLRGLSASLAGGRIPVDVWVDGDGRVRQMHNRMPLGTTDMEMTVQFSDFGLAVDVAEPSATEVVDMASAFPKAKSGG